MADQNLFINNETEDTSVNTETETTETAEATQEANVQENKTPEPSFSQADIDRIINQRLARFQRETEKKIAAAREEGRSEAEKLAKLSESQRLEHERMRADEEAKKRESELAQREQEITRRELRAEAIETLQNKGLPKELEALLDYSGADACNTSIATLEKVFRNAVQMGIDDRIHEKQSAPLKRGNSADGEAALLAQMRHAAGLKDN